MNTKLYETILDMTIDSFQDSGTSPGPLKVITIRPSAYSIALVDHLAQELAMSRQAMLDHIINDGIRDAVDGYCDAHGLHAEEVKKTFCEEFHAKWQAQNEEQSK
jgi:hypothetical protein